MLKKRHHFSRSQIYRKGKNNDYYKICMQEVFEKLFSRDSVTWKKNVPCKIYPISDRDSFYMSLFLTSKKKKKIFFVVSFRIEKYFTLLYRNSDNPLLLWFLVVIEHVYIYMINNNIHIKTHIGKWTRTKDTTYSHDGWLKRLPDSICNVIKSKCF